MLKSLTEIRDRALSKFERTFLSGPIDSVFQLEEYWTAVDSIIEELVARAVSTNYKIMGMGHAVYKTTDARVPIIRLLIDRKLADLTSRGIMALEAEVLYRIAERLAAAVEREQYFADKGVYPNVDFFTSILSLLLGFRSDWSVLVFALGRIAGWLAHIRELFQGVTEDDKRLLIRPYGLYNGEEIRPYEDIEFRK